MNRFLFFTFSWLLLQSLACADDFPSGQPREYQDFGTEVFLLLREEVARSDNNQAKLPIMDKYQFDLITGLNQTIAGRVADKLPAVLINVLPLYDNVLENGVETPGSIPALTRDLAGVLEKFSPNYLNMEAMVQISSSRGESTYRSVDDLISNFLRYDKRILPTFADLFERYETQVTDFIEWLSPKLMGIENKTPSDKENFLKKLLQPAVSDSWLQPDAEYHKWSQILQTPVWAIRLDKKGNPSVNYSNGRIMPPYKDTDGDGMVDADLEGVPVGSINEKIEIPPFDKPLTVKNYSGVDIYRDAEGRALTPENYLFQYFDVKRSTLGLALRNLYGMVDRDWHNLLVSVLVGILPKVYRLDAKGPFQGIDIESNGLKDLLWGLKEIITYKRLPQLVQSITAVVSGNPDLLKSLLTETARALYILFKGQRSLKKGNNFLDHLLPFVETIAKNGMFRSLLAKFGDPRFAYLPVGWAKMIQYTKLDWDTLEANGWTDIKKPEDVDALPLDPLAITDWSQPEKEYFDDPDENKSMNQKLLQLGSNADGCKMIISIEEQEIEDLMVTDSLAYMFMSGIANNAYLDYMVNTNMITVAINMIPEFSTRCNTTPPAYSICKDSTHQQQYPGAKCFCAAPAREQTVFILHDHTQFGGNSVDLDEIPVRDHYGKLLAATQATQMGIGLEPLMEVFSLSGNIQNPIDLFTVLHQHWGSKEKAAGQEFYYNGYIGHYHSAEYGSNIRAIEEYLMHIFGKTQFLEKSFELLKAFDTTNTSFEGVQINAGDELTLFLKFLFDSDTPVVNWNGSTTFYMNDGKTVLEKPARIYPLLNGLRKMIDAFDNLQGTQKEDWKKVGLIDFFLGVKYRNTLCGSEETDRAAYLECVNNIGTTELANQTTLPILLSALTALSGQIDAAVTPEDAGEFYTDMVEFLQSRAFASLFDIINIIQNTAAYHTVFTDFYKYAFNPEANTSGMFPSLLKVAADLGQLKIDTNAILQLLRFFGEIIRPEDRLVFRTIKGLNQILQKDPEAIFAELFSNLFASAEIGQNTPFKTFYQVLKELFRVTPGSSGSYNTADFSHILDQLKTFLQDKSTGLERLYEIIQSRNYLP